MPPPVAVARTALRTPHPLSLVPLSSVFVEGTEEYTALSQYRALVPPLAHRRGLSSRPLEVRVRTTISAVLDVDLVEQTFKCSFFLDATWMDYGLKGDQVGLDRPQTINLKLSDQRKGSISSNEDLQHYFFCPQLRFRNLVDGDLEESYDVYDDGFETTPAVVAYRVSGTARFHCRLPLNNFPFDSQTLKIELNSAWPAAHVRLVRNLKDEFRSVLAVERFTLKNEYHLSEMVHLLSRVSDPQHSSSGTTYSYLEIQMRVRRRLAFWIWNLWLPFYAFSALAFPSMMVEVTWVEQRLSITLTMILTLVSYRFSLLDSLPKIHYLTFIDKYFLLCIAVVTTLTVQAMVICYRTQANPLSIVVELHNWEIPSEPQSIQRLRMVQCWIAWLVFNIALPAVVLTARSIQRSMEALLWWDCRENVLWLGPIEAGSELSKSTLQAALDGALISVRAARRSVGGSSSVGSEAAESETEEVGSPRMSQAKSTSAQSSAAGRMSLSGRIRQVDLAAVRVVTPSLLYDLRKRSPFQLPLTRQSFVLLEFGSQAEAMCALELLREAQTRDAEARTEELRAAAAVVVAGSSRSVAAAAARASAEDRSEVYDKDQGGAAEGSQEPGSPHASPRTRGRTQAFSSALASALARSTTALDALPRTLEEVMRHWRVGERNIVVEFSLPEYKFLLDAAEMSSGRLGAALFRIRMLLRHTVNPRAVQPINPSRSWRTSHASGNASSGRMSFYTPRASLSQLAGDAVSASRASIAALFGRHSRHNSLASMASMRFTMQPADLAEDATGGWGHPGGDEPLPAGPASGASALALHRQKMAAQRQAAALGGDAPQMPPRIPGRSSLKARSSYTGAVGSVLMEGLNADIPPAPPPPPPPPPARTPPTPPTPPHYAMPTESAAIALAERPVSSATQRRALMTPTTASRSKQTPP